MTALPRYIRQREMWWREQVCCTELKASMVIGTFAIADHLNLLPDIRSRSPQQITYAEYLPWRSTRTAFDALPAAGLMSASF